MRALVLAGIACLASPGAGRAQAPAAGPGAAPIALVISNTAYAGLPRLPGCEVSANLVASVLSRAGFKVARQTNPSNARLGTAIANLGEEAASLPDARAVIYFCGYVSGYSDRLFLVPVEARLERDADVLSQGIVARLLMGSVAGPDTRAGLVLMDVATLPGQLGKLPFDSMLRPADAAHGGLAAATMLAAEGQGPAPLAGALADMIADGRMEARDELTRLRTAPSLARTLLIARPPAEPSWLVGAPAPAAAPAPVPPAPVPPAQVPPAPVPPTAAIENPAAASPPSPQALAEPNPAERRRVQLGLQRLGYYRGRVNGVFGPDTLTAIRQFQKDSGADATGKPTIRQMEQLLAP